MAEPPRDPVALECHAYCLYLCGSVPTPATVDAYRRGLNSAGFHAGLLTSAADGLLDTAARGGGVRLGLADTYARLVAPAGRLRRSLILLCAILESSPGTWQRFEPPAAGRVRAWLHLVAAGLRFAIRLPVAVLLIGPPHLVLRVVRGRPSLPTGTKTS